MSSKRHGWIQFGCVVGFILMALVISRMLERPGAGVQTGAQGDRTLFVETVRVAPGPYRIEFSTTGILSARSEIAIVPEVSGRVVKVHESFFLGGAFDSADTLFVIEPRDFQLQVQRAEAELARAKTTMEVEQAQAAVAIQDWQRVHGDKPAPDLVARRPQIAEAKAGLRSAQAQLEEARLALERTRFTLPFSGRVLESSVAPGQYVVAGQSYGRVFDIGALEVRSSLEDRQLNWLLNSENAQITLATTFLGEKRHYPARLNRGASSLDSNTRFATVTFAFNDEVRELLPGLFMEILVQGAELEGITEVPIAAIQEQGLLWRVNAQSRLEPVTVETVYIGATHAAVRGLTGSEEIVVSRLSGATAGMRVIAQADRSTSNLQARADQ